MRAKLHNPSNPEPQFVPGIGLMTDGEWVEVDPEEFKQVNGYDLVSTNTLEVEGQPLVTDEEEEEEDE